MKTQQEILSLIEQFIHETFPLARQRKIASNTSLIDSGIVDSLGILEIVTFLESEFQIALTDEELLSEHFDSIESLTAFVAEKTGAAQIIA